MNLFGKIDFGPRLHEDRDYRRWCYKGGSTVQQSPPSTSTQVTEPWAEQKPFLTRGFEQAQQQFEGDKPEYFPDSTVTPFNALQTQAQTGMAQRAQTGSPLLGQAQGQVGATLRGDYLNPDISGVASAIDAQLRPRIGAQFAQAGRNLSPAHAGTYASGFTNAISPYAFNANQAERGRQMDAAQVAPGLANADYTDINQLAAVGAQQQGLSQANLEDEINRFNFGQTLDQNKLREYTANITGNYGGTRSTESVRPIYSNPLRAGLGNAGTAVGIGQGLFGKGNGQGIFPGGGK